MKRKMKWLVICWILVVLFLGLTAFPLNSIAQQRDRFPSNANLEARNVALHMRLGFKFPGGILPDENGNANCNGLDVQITGGGGSGFIVKEDGTIVTNYHVASKMLVMTAEFPNGSTYEIRNIRVYDRDNDIAILKINSNRRFPVVNLGDSDRLQPQDRVLAVGNAGNRGINITEGMVSQVPRDDHGKPVWIRHTAQIEPGNSGGALYKGDKVVGVNESVNLTLGGTSLSGIGNAVPINKVKSLLQNPTFAKQLIPLISAFPGIQSPDGRRIEVSLQGLALKADLLGAKNGQVPAATGNKPGHFDVGPIPFSGLVDYYILVQSPERPLGLALLNERSELVGCGMLPVANNSITPLVISSEYDQDIWIRVLNYGNTPADFGLEVDKIVW